MKCLICGEKTNDLLFYRKSRRKKIIFWDILLDETRSLCRKHLIEEFKRGFCNFQGKLVVFYPDFDEKTKPEDYAYAYVSLSDMQRKREQEGYDVQTAFMENTLQSIKGLCIRCGNIASVAYFKKGILKWKKFGLIKWDTPLIEEVTEDPEILCKKCCYQEIESPLKHFKGDFSALVIPYGENGMYFPRSY